MKPTPNCFLVQQCINKKGTANNRSLPSSHRHHSPLEIWYSTVWKIYHSFICQLLRTKLLPYVQVRRTKTTETLLMQGATRDSRIWNHPARSSHISQPNFMRKNQLLLSKWTETTFPSFSLLFYDLGVGQINQKIFCVTFHCLTLHRCSKTRQLLELQENKFVISSSFSHFWSLCIEKSLVYVLYRCSKPFKE